MSVILSLSQSNGMLYAAGPEGLYKVGDSGELAEVIQPQRYLYACCALPDRVLVGGAPHGVAYSLKTGDSWQGGWMDHVDSAVMSLTAAPDVAQSQVLLAGTEDKGILRSANNGEGWYVCNFGLESLNILHVCWAPPYPTHVWPRWQLAFACTDEGIYRSPASGRGWKRCRGAVGVFQVAAVDVDFQKSERVLAGTEDTGLWISENKGQDFKRVPDAPQRINALVALEQGGYLLSDETHLWSSPDGLKWVPHRDQDACLVLQEAGNQIWAGGQDGLRFVDLSFPH